MASSRWVCILLLSRVAIPGCDRAPPPLAPTRPPVVVVTRPVTDEITDFEDFTGHIEAVQSVEVRARVTGYLDKVNFEDGTEVDEKDLLFEIDPRPYQVELQRGEANLAQSESHRQRLDADHRRAVSLLNRGAISREEFDRIAGEAAEAGAAVGVAQASRDLAQLNLGFTKVSAPIGGRISRRHVDPGNLVKADETVLTTIVSLDPMHAYFDIDERTLLRLRRLVREGKIKSRQEAEIPILIELADEEGFPHRGTINFSENKIDPSTGTLRVRGVLPNPKPPNSTARLFSPGLFVRVRLPIGAPRRAILIPEQALGTDQGRRFLYVVNPQDEVVYRPVEVGLLKAGLRVIDEGLALEERVIVSGLQRVRPGEKVEPKTADAARTPGGDAITIRSPLPPGEG